MNGALVDDIYASRIVPLLLVSLAPMLASGLLPRLIKRIGKAGVEVVVAVYNGESHGIGADLSSLRVMR